MNIVDSSSSANATHPDDNSISPDASSDEVRKGNSMTTSFVSAQDA